MMRAGLRVLHVAPSAARSYGGPTYSVIGFARSAASLGISNAVLCPAPLPEDEEWFRRSIEPVPVTLLRSRGNGAFVYSSEISRWLACNGQNFDVIHIHGLFNPISSLAARECRRRGWAYVIHPFGTLSRYTFHHRRRLLKKLYFRWIDRPSLMTAAAMHFTTAEEREEALRHGIDWRQRAHIVPPPFVGEFDSTIDKASLSRPVVLCMARLHPVKHVELLLDAWPSVVAQMPAARLIIAGDGDGSYPSQLREMAANATAPGSISFPGFVVGKEKAALLGQANLFVLPSYHENFGVAVLEAVAAGCPAIVTREVQLSSWLVENKIGLITPRDSVTLGRQIVATLRDTSLQNHCQKYGPSLVTSAFSTDAVGNLLLQMYESAVATGSTRRRANRQ